MERVQTALLVTLLAVMIGVAAYQIVARNLFGTGLHWGSDLVQVAMLWVTMVGATAAAGSNRHISIDLVARFADARLRRWAARITALFAACLCAALAWYSIAFIRLDFLYDTPGFGIVPAWLCESIIPIAAATMAVEYVVVDDLAAGRPATDRDKRPSEAAMIWAGVALIVLMALLGAPLFVVVLAAAMLGLLATGVDPAAVAISIYEITHQPLLVALPFFTFAGYLMAAARTSERLMALTQALFGWMPAGLAVVGFVACALFTALTGASGVTIVALGGLLLPMLVSSGYSERFSLGLVTTSGSLGLLLVPSVPLILYGVVAQQLGQGEPFTIQQMFMAGLGPTLLMVVLLSCYATLVHAGAPRTPFNGRALVKALKASRWELPLPVIVLGGIYSGYFAISEAAAMTAVYIFVAEVLLYREIKWRNLPGVIRESMVMVGSILLILAWRWRSRTIS